MKVDLTKKDPEDELWFRICEGEGCVKIIDLPYEKWKNTKYCTACRERVRLDEKREYMKKKRSEMRDLAYGDSILIESNERISY